MGNDISLVKSSYVLSIFNTKINQLIQALIILLGCSYVVYSLTFCVDKHDYSTSHTSHRRRFFVTHSKNQSNQKKRFTFNTRNQ